MKPPYDVFSDRWGSQDFSSYVQKLEAQADNALQGASQVGALHLTSCPFWSLY